MTYNYKPHGVCARGISFDIENGKVVNIKFSGGCSGNTQGVSALADGMEASELIEKLSGIRCGFKNTSCPDQLAKAVAKALEE